MDERIITIKRALTIFLICVDMVENHQCIRLIPEVFVDYASGSLINNPKTCLKEWESFFG